MSTRRPHRRPVPKAAPFFDEHGEGTDPAMVAEAAEQAASVLIRGARGSEDGAVADRIIHLADTEGIDALAELWSHAAADSLAGCLWRLYLLRSWVYADPATAAREFDAGRRHAEFARVVAGVADPPGPDELRRMIDEVLRGIAEGDFADVLLRAAAFARVVAAGRAALGDTGTAADGTAVRRMLVLAEQLESAGHLELDRGLG